MVVASLSKGKMCETHTDLGIKRLTPTICFNPFQKQRIRFLGFQRRFSRKIRIPGFRMEMEGSPTIGSGVYSKDELKPFPPRFEFSREDCFQSEDPISKPKELSCPAWSLKALNVETLSHYWEDVPFNRGLNPHYKETPREKINQGFINPGLTLLTCSVPGL